MTEQLSTAAHSFFKFSSHLGYYRILSRVPCAIQQILVFLFKLKAIHSLYTLFINYFTEKNTCTSASNGVFLLHPRLYPIIYSPEIMQPQVPMSPRCHPSPPTSSWFPKGPLCTAEGKSSCISTPPTMSLGPAATGEATQTSCILVDLSGEDGCVCVCQSLSCVSLIATSYTVAYQSPLSMGLSTQENWSGLPCSRPGDLPDPGIKPGSPAFQVNSLLSEPPGKPREDA